MMLKPFIALFICLSVAACGGGGGSSSPARIAGGGTGSGFGSGSGSGSGGSTDACGPAAQVQFVKEVAESYYYWYDELAEVCLLYTSPSPRDRQKSRMPSSA